MSDVVLPYTYLSEYVPNDYTLAGWITANIYEWNMQNMNGRFNVEMRKDLFLKCSHRWELSYDTLSAIRCDVERYKLTISTTVSKYRGNVCDCHVNPRRISCEKCEYPDSDSDSDNVIEYSEDDITALSSQLVPGTRLEFTLFDVPICTISSNVLRLFDISNENNWIFKGFPGDPDNEYWNYSVLDKTDKIGANAVFSALLLGIQHLDASGNFISIYILFWLELLKRVNFSMLHLQHLDDL